MQQIAGPLVNEETRRAKLQLCDALDDLPVKLGASIGISNSGLQRQNSKLDGAVRIIGHFARFAFANFYP
jgi:hypothetical protein